LHPVSSPSPNPSPELKKQPRAVMAAELLALDPALTDARLLSHLPAGKLAAMLETRRRSLPVERMRA
jgi:hypothetical protein